VLVEAGEAVSVTGNTIRSNDEDIRLDIQPPPPGGGGDDPPAGVLLAPTDDSMIDNGSPDSTFGSATLLKWKRNASGDIQRVAYYRFEVDDPAGVETATFELSAKLTASNPADASYHFQVRGVDDDGWSEADLTWNTAPARGAADAVDVGAFTMDGPLEQVERIRVDVTDYVRGQDDGVVTLIVLDTIGQNGNVDSYSKERATDQLRPGLRVAR
jgi:hypothetical protein